MDQHKDVTQEDHTEGKRTICTLLYDTRTRYAIAVRDKKTIRTYAKPEEGNRYVLPTTVLLNDVR